MAPLLFCRVFHRYAQTTQEYYLYLSPDPGISAIGFASIPQTAALRAQGLGPGSGLNVAGFCLHYCAKPHSIG